MSKLNELEKLLTRGKITRREFIKQVSALGLMAAVSPALLSDKAQAATPKQGGRLIIGSAEPMRLVGRCAPSPRGRGPVGAFNSARWRRLLRAPRNQFNAVLIGAARSNAASRRLRPAVSSGLFSSTSRISRGHRKRCR